VRERIAEALIADPNRNFWAEIEKIRNNRAGCSRTVYGCTDENTIARVFAAKYENLYTSVPYDTGDISEILADLKADISLSSKATDIIVNAKEIQDAIVKLKLHKNDGNSSLSSDHFICAGADLSFHMSFLFSAIFCHGSFPTDFTVSTVIPLPKKRNGFKSDSDNFRGIALGSMYGKIIDNVILNKYYNKLCTSDSQFGFKHNSSTNMCTMILKETVHIMFLIIALFIVHFLMPARHLTG
jgi:hypothetical protein